MSKSGDGYSYLWVSTFFNASGRVRRALVKAVLDSITYFGADWKKLGYDNSGAIPQYKLKSKNKEVEKFVKQLIKEKGLKLVGVSPEITYMKVDGTDLQLNALWEHKFGSPTLLYASEELPILILAGPSIMFNDSIRNRIKENEQRDNVNGITG